MNTVAPVRKKPPGGTLVAAKLAPPTLRQGPAEHELQVPRKRYFPATHRTSSCCRITMLPDAAHKC